MPVGCGPFDGDSMTTSPPVAECARFRRTAAIPALWQGSAVAEPLSQSCVATLTEMLRYLLVLIITIIELPNYHHMLPNSDAAEGSRPGMWRC